MHTEHDRLASGVADRVVAPAMRMGTKLPAAAAPQVYWEQRAREFAGRGRGLAAVCSYAMPAFYNQSIEYCQRRALLPCLPHAPAAGATALDVGCGIGRWSLELAARGYAVTGLDLSPYMIEQARLRAARGGATCSFAVGDVAELDLGRRFDAIVCVTVLQHILDPTRVREALARLAAHLARAGRLVLLEAAPARGTQRCNTAVFQARPLDWYLEALQDAGLSVIARSGVDPMPLKTWLLPYYRRMPQLAGHLTLAATTALTLPVDWLLGRWLSRWSWHQVLVVGHSGELPA